MSEGGSRAASKVSGAGSKVSQAGRASPGKARRQGAKNSAAKKSSVSFRKSFSFSSDNESLEDISQVTTSPGFLISSYFSALHQERQEREQ